MNRLSSTGKIKDREGARNPAVGYRFLRGCLRVWLKLFYRPVSVLGSEAGLPPSGPVLLMVAHPPSFLDTLILIATFDRPIRCFLDRQFIPGVWARLLGRGLGLIPDDGSQAGLERASGVAARGEPLLVFAQLEKSQGDGEARFGGRAVQVAAEVDRRLAGAAHPAIIPVHVFKPQAPLDSLDVAIHLEPPLGPDPAGQPRQVEDLLAPLDAAFRRNVFRLRPRDLRDFLADLEETLRQNLESEPVSPTERKPQLDGFALSGFLVEWAEQENRLNPGRLVALATELDSWRERHRDLSLRELEAETCGPWIRSAWKRAAVWIEAVAGFPVAVLGLVNCVVALAALRAAGLARIEKPGENLRRWLARSGIVLAVFAAQILACDLRWGRSGAGLYALGLPLSGLYLWRYAWLLVHRTRLLVWKVKCPRARARLEEGRRRWLCELDRARDAYAKGLGIAH
jgi:1-acyl-sn-glycerol-3-phosphate acyltransferase